MAVSSWVGGGEVMVAAQSGGGGRVIFQDEVSWRDYMRGLGYIRGLGYMRAAQSSEEDIRRINYVIDLAADCCSSCLPPSRGVIRDSQNFPFRLTTNTIRHHPFSG